MATFHRFLGHSIRQNVLPLLRNKNAWTVRMISTSNKNKDSIIGEIDEKIAVKEEKVASEVTKPKPWISYGYDYKDELEDTMKHREIMFLSVTCGIVLVSFVWSYLPDFREKDWAHREAFLELARREKAGLPPINRDYLDPSLIELPSDEELGDMEIVI